MSQQSWIETLTTQQAIGTIFDTYTTSKSVINPQALYTFPPNYFAPGRCLEIMVGGALNTLVTTPGTITFEVKLGPTANIVAFSSGAIQMNATAHTLLPFYLEMRMTCRAVGSGTSANIVGLGRLGGVMFTLTAAQVDDLNTPGLFLVPATTPGVGAGFDSTISNILDFWAGFSISSASNRIRVDQYIVKSLN